jgi:CRP-like cAMP-binding protein
VRDLGPRRIGRELFLAAFGLPIDVIEPWVIDRITSLLSERWIDAGSTLYREGDPPDHLYFMLEGAIRLTREGSPPWTMRGRWVVGVLEGMTDVPRMRTATALVDFQAMQVPARSWVEIMEDSFQLARGAVLNAARATAHLEESVPRIEHPIARPRVLPAVGEAPLSMIERLALLSEVRMLGGAGVQSIVDLAAVARESRFEAGEVLLPRGVERHDLLLVVSGEVAAGREDPHAERVYGPGDVVCGAASFGTLAPFWEARAATPVRVIAFPIEVWFDLMEEHFDLVRSTLGALGARRELLLDRMAAGREELVLT